MVDWYFNSEYFMYIKWAQTELSLWPLHVVY